MKKLFFALLLLAVFLVACVQPEKRADAPTPIASPSSEQLPAEVLEQEQAPDGLDDALKELQELEEVG